MKQSLALFLSICTLLSVAVPYTVYSEPQSSATTAAPTTSDLPLTEEPPVTEEPPLTEEPPITEEPPVTEELSPEEALRSLLYNTVELADSEWVYETLVELEAGVVERVCTAILSDYPEFFHLDKIAVQTSVVTLPDAPDPVYRYRFTFTYLFSQGQELDDARAFIQEKTDEILSLIPENADVLGQLLFLHDYICTHFSYVPTQEHRDIYCLLEDKTGNCQAYANLYSFLLNRLGIENEFVLSASMNHLWNQVKLGDDWYHVDLCWDDPSVDQAGRALHTNFLRSDEGLASTNHYGFTAPNPCTSTLYEDSFLPDIGGAIIQHQEYGYGVSRSRRALLQIDWDTMTATPVVDLSALRWAVWNTPGTLWKEQYLNLHSDGRYIYFNGPSSLWRYDTELHQVDLLYEFHSSQGYLYSLAGNGHTLTCTVSKAPGIFDDTFTFETAHVFPSEGNEFYSVEFCPICGQAGAVYTPGEEELISAGISVRPSGEGTHDLRLLLFVNSHFLATSPAMQVKISLFAGTEERYATGILSADQTEGFILYESFWADGMICTVNDGYQVNGLILLGLANGSYDGIVVSITYEDELVYWASLSADALFSPTEDPDDPVDPDFSVDPEEPDDPLDPLSPIQ